MNDLTTEGLTKKEIAILESGATRERAYNKLVEMTDARNIVLDKFGEEHSVPDNPTQLRAAELILRVNNDLKEGVTIENKTVNISGVSEKMVGGLLDMVKDMTAQLKALKANGCQTGEILDAEIC